MIYWRYPFLIDKPFEKTFKNDLLPVFRKYLAAHPQRQIIWMHQSSTSDLLAPIVPEVLDPEVHVKKIHQYNNIIRRILKYKTQTTEYHLY